MITSDKPKYILKDFSRINIIDKRTTKMAITEREKF